jgi:hypothetical protein
MDNREMDQMKRRIEVFTALLDKTYSTVSSNGMSWQRQERIESLKWAIEKANAELTAAQPADLKKTA